VFDASGSKLSSTTVSPNPRVPERQLDLSPVSKTGAMERAVILQENKGQHSDAKQQMKQSQGLID
jgi:hypothetical protein